jgi:hypothetical protein
VAYLVLDVRRAAATDWARWVGSRCLAGHLAEPRYPGEARSDARPMILMSLMIQVVRAVRVGQLQSADAVGHLGHRVVRADPAMVPARVCSLRSPLSATSCA